MNLPLSSSISTGSRLRLTVCRLVFAVLLLGVGVATTSPVRAQESSDPETIPLRAGAWALQFNVGQNFTLDSFLGSTISAKRHTSPARAWQLGLTLAANVVSNDIDDGPSRTDDRQTVAVTARYLAYPFLGGQDSESIQLYLGAGPLVEFRRTSQGEGTQSQWGIGVSGTIGAEWFVHPRIGLNAAYESSLRYARDRLESEDGPGRTTNQIRLDAGGARLGVSVYF